MKRGIITICCLVSLLSTTAFSAPLWQGKGRIAISSDGNEHDHDDWAATPLTLALLASQGIQDKMVLYTYSDHVWGSNMTHPNRGGMSAYEHMQESAMEGKRWFGFDNSRFICAVDDPELSYCAMRDVINASSGDDPLIIIAAGPMQVVGEGLNRSDIEARKYVTVLSHSEWNNRHSDKPMKEWDKHSGWTFAKMRTSFGSAAGGGVTFIQIADQNGGDDYHGFNAPIELFDWVKSSPARDKAPYKSGSWDWLYGRLRSCIKNKGQNFDPSDAGMIVYLFTGVEKSDPAMARELMENPIVR